jgi:hypothetical protein
MSNIITQHILAYSFSDDVKDASTVIDTNNIDITWKDIIQSDSLLTLASMQKNFDVCICLSVYDCIGTLQKRIHVHFVGKHSYTDEFLGIFSILKYSLMQKAMLIYHDEDVLNELQCAAQLYNIDITFMQSFVKICLKTDLEIKPSLFSEMNEEIREANKIENVKTALNSISDIDIKYVVMCRLNFSLW